jgi:hypothetical protein
VKLAAAEGDETFPGSGVTAPYFAAVRDALDHWQRDAPPPISVHDCAQGVRAYECAGLPTIDSPSSAQAPNWTDESSVLRISA